MRLTGTEAQLARAHKLPGVEVLDHGQRQLDGGRWQVSAQVSGAAALEGLRAVGIEIQQFDRGGP